MVEPLTLQDLALMDGMPVWVGEPINEWRRVNMPPEIAESITTDQKIRSGVMLKDGELFELPPIQIYREPPDWSIPKMNFQLRHDTQEGDFDESET